ncbi:MAG: peptidoglycan DD-metalloendopeptidase family protein [Prevotellaceae bacterium]|jgi:murein DD-endopeptidase MepM/ murein hydrolase activator NlpD|nr:peptidoglycan DD-metalloendopeptidase family protein [Prevotellaceae bacterium]
MKRIFFILFLFCSFVFAAYSQKPNNQNIASDSVKKYIAYATTVTCKKSLSGAVVEEANPIDAKKVQHSVKQDDNIVFFDESKDELEDYDVPSDKLYNFSWSSEFLNPYKVSINDLPDSTLVDCRNFVFPVNTGSITSPFGTRHGRFHYGTDIALHIGDTVKAAFDGTVRIVDYEPRGYGNYIVIRHNNGLESVYAHLSKSLVENNQTIKSGEIIGLGGTSGRSTGPHLHFELRFLGNAFNTDKIVDYDNHKIRYDTYFITKKETYRHKSDLERLKQLRYHRIGRGETLSTIARRYGTTVANLCQLNHLNKGTTLKIGRSIRYR